MLNAMNYNVYSTFCHNIQLINNLNLLISILLYKLIEINVFKYLYEMALNVQRYFDL